jgi:hypothetical protein
MFFSFVIGGVAVVMGNLLEVLKYAAAPTHIEDVSITGNP